MNRGKIIRYAAMLSLSATVFMTGCHTILAHDVNQYANQRVNYDDYGVEIGEYNPKSIIVIDSLPEGPTMFIGNDKNNGKYLEMDTGKQVEIRTNADDGQALINNTVYSYNPLIFYLTDEERESIADGKMLTKEDLYNILDRITQDYNENNKPRAK